MIEYQPIEPTEEELELAKHQHVTIHRGSVILSVKPLPADLFKEPGPCCNCIKDDEPSEDQESKTKAN